MNLREKISELQINGWVAIVTLPGRTIRKAVGKEVDYQIGTMGYNDSRIIKIRNYRAEEATIVLHMTDKGTVQWKVVEA